MCPPRITGWWTCSCTPCRSTATKSIEQHHGITKDGLRYFGLLSLRSPYTGYTDTVGLRNSHDKSFPIGIAFGAKVFVCDNLSFIADHVIRRKHTANAKRDLAGLVGELVEPASSTSAKRRPEPSGTTRPRP